jgi:serine O-acetyltransferase
MFSKLTYNIDTVLQRDPAARSRLEVLLCYPGVHALAIHQLSNWCWRQGFITLARFVSNIGRFLTAIEIHPGATIGSGVFIDHGIGVIIGETAVVGDGCTIYQGVTLGGTSLERSTKRHPTLESGVIVGAGAKVLGGFTVGKDARIGSNAVVVKAVPPGATAIGIPARIIQNDSDVKREETANRMGFSSYGVTTSADDPLAQAIHQMIDHISRQDTAIEQLQTAVCELSRGKTLVDCPAPLDTSAISKLVE